MEGLRLDSHCFSGYMVPPFYDSLLAKMIIGGKDRTEALQKTREALSRFEVEGIETNISFLSFLTNNPDFESGNYNTRWVEKNIDQFMPVG